MTNKEKLNHFFVSCFYSILAAEEKVLESITNGKLTLKEIHVIEAVFRTKATGGNTFTNIANTLRVTLGTLTTAFLKLEQKGYLTKEQDKNDKRVYYIEPTRLAELINDEHAVFHERMIEGVLTLIPEKEVEHLVGALQLLDEFFRTLG